MNRILSSFFVMYAALTLSVFANASKVTSNPAPVDYLKQSYADLRTQFEKIHPGLTTGAGADGSVHQAMLFMRKAGGDKVHDISVRLERLRADASRVLKKYPNDRSVRTFIGLLEEFEFSWGMYQRGEDSAAQRLSINFAKTDKLFAL